MIDETKLLAALSELHKVATESMMESNAKGGRIHAYHSGVVDGLNTAIKMAKLKPKLATAPPQAEGDDSEQ